MHVPSPQQAIPTRRPAAQKEEDPSGSSRVQFLAGKTHPFQLALTNPLYDPIQVRLVVQRQQTPAPPDDPFNEDKDKPRRPPYTINLPNTAFSIAAFAEAWEYEDDEEMYGIDDDDLLGLSPVKDRGARGKMKTVGVLEKKANTTVVGGEVMLERDARGDVKVSSFQTLLDLKWIITSTISSSTCSSPTHIARTNRPRMGMPKLRQPCQNENLK